MERIDDDIKDKIEDDIHTEEVIINPTPNVPDEPTPQPTSPPEKPIVPNDDSKDAEEVTPTKPENKLDEDKKEHDDGGDEEAQREADQEEQKPADDLDDVLKDLGID